MFAHPNHKPTKYIHYSLMATFFVVSLITSNMLYANAKHHPKPAAEKKAVPATTDTSAKNAAQGGVSTTPPAKAGMGAKGKGGMGGKGAMAGFGKDKMALGMQGKLPTPKNLYPTLMSLPALSFEQREKVVKQASERMVTGLNLIIMGRVLTHYI